MGSPELALLIKRFTDPGSWPHPTNPETARRALDTHWSDPYAVQHPPTAHLGACFTKFCSRAEPMPSSFLQPACDELALLWPLALLARATELGSDPSQHERAELYQAWGERLAGTANKLLGSVGVERVARSLACEDDERDLQAWRHAQSSPQLGGAEPGFSRLTNSLLRWACSDRWVGARGCPARHFSERLSEPRALIAVSSLASMACSQGTSLGPAGRALLSILGPVLCKTLFEDASRERRVDWALPELCGTLREAPWSLPMPVLLLGSGALRAPWALTIVRAARGHDGVALHLLTQARDAGLLAASAWSGPWKGTHPLFEFCPGRHLHFGADAGRVIDLLSGLGYGADWSLPDGFEGKARLPADADAHFLLQWLRSNRIALVEATRATRASQADPEAVGSRKLTALARLNRLAANPYDTGAAEALKLWSPVADPTKLARQRSPLESASTPAIAEIIRARMAEIADRRAPAAAPPQPRARP